MRVNLQLSPAKQLRDLRDLLNKEIQQLLTMLGCKVSPETFYNRVIKPELGCNLDYGYVPKWLLELFFSAYPRLISDWQTYPAQTLFGFDFGGEHNQIKSIEFFLPDAVLYEDMCMAYNQAVLSKYESRRGSVDKIRSKTHQFYLRTSILSAFYFVEAYLNGIAFDFYFPMRGNRQLPQEDLDKLSEYDSQRDREKWLSFRDKMLQYPKIILGTAKHPPLTETNCEEMRILLSEAKELRDSLVHNSPTVEAEITHGKRQLIGKKVRMIVNLRLEEATTIVDAAIRYVKRLDALLQANGRHRKLDWLFERDESGIFPAKTFE